MQTPLSNNPTERRLESALEGAPFGDAASKDNRTLRLLVVILWPSFLVAACAVGIFFTTFDPVELSLFGQPLSMSRLGAYSIGFFFFWALGAASSALTYFFLKSAAEVNRYPIPDPVARPVGCPKREDPDASSG